MKCWKFLELLHNWQLLKRGSAAWVSDEYVTLQEVCSKIKEGTSGCLLKFAGIGQNCKQNFDKGTFWKRAALAQLMWWLVYELENRSTCIWLLAGTDIFVFYTVQTVSRAHPISCSMHTDASFLGVYGKLGWIGAAGEWDFFFFEKLALSVTDSAVIAAAICSVSLNIREGAGKILRAANSVFERQICVLKLVFQGKQRMRSFENS
jgi:hypothetical protein